MRRRGRLVARITATAAAASVPLGALVPLLPSPSGAPDPVALFDRTVEAFRERTGGGALVLLVDDVHFGGRPATARRWLAEARALCREFG
jgi:hypothetical protein